MSGQNGTDKIVHKCPVGPNSDDTHDTRETDLRSNNILFSKMQQMIQVIKTIVTEDIIQLLIIDPYYEKIYC